MPTQINVEDINPFSSTFIATTDIQKNSNKTLDVLKSIFTDDANLSSKKEVGKATEKQRNLSELSVLKSTCAKLSSSNKVDVFSDKTKTHQEIKDKKDVLLTENSKIKPSAATPINNTFSSIDKPLQTQSSDDECIEIVTKKGILIIVYFILQIFYTN